MLGEEESQVEIPDAPLSSEIMLRTALCEGDEAKSTSPVGEVSVPAEEIVEFSIGESSHTRKV